MAVSSKADFIEESFQKIYHNIDYALFFHNSFFVSNLLKILNLLVHFDKIRFIIPHKQPLLV